MHRYAYCGNDPVNYVDPMGTYGIGMVATINGGGGGSSSLGRSYEPELPLGPMWDIPDMGNTGQASRSTNTSSTNRNTGSNTTRTTTSTQRPNTSSPQPAPAKTSGSSPPPPQPKPDRSKIFSGGLSGILGGIAIGVGIAALTVATGGLALPTIIAAGTIVSGAGLVAYGGMEIGEGITGKNPVRDFVGDDIYYTGYMLASTGSVLGTGYCSMYVRMYGPGAQPVQVVGKPHGSAQHQKIIMDKVKELEQTGKYSKIFVNKALNTAGFNGTQRPDIIAVAKNGIAHIFEVASPSQLAGRGYEQLIQKVNTILENNPGMTGDTIIPQY